MPKLIEAPDLTKRSNKSRLIEAPDLTLKKLKETTRKLTIEKPKVAKDSSATELTTIRGDISELHRTVKQLINAELQTSAVVTDLSERGQGIVLNLNELTDKVKEIGDDGVNNETIKELKKDIDWLLTEVDRINNAKLKEPKMTYMVNEGMTQSQKDKLDEIGSKVPSVVPDSSFKKVTNIYVEPISGELVVIHEQ